MEKGIYNLTIRIKRVDIARLKIMAKHFDRPISTMARVSIKKYLKFFETHIINDKVSDEEGYKESDVKKRN